MRTIVKLVLVLALLAPAAVAVASPAGAHQSASHCSAWTTRYSTVWAVSGRTNTGHVDCAAYDFANCKRQLPGGGYTYTGHAYVGTAYSYSSGSTGTAYYFCPSGYTTHVQQTPWTYKYVL